MKNTKLITLGLFLAGATLALAQDTTATSGQSSGARAGRSSSRSEGGELSAEQNAERAANYNLAEAANKAREAAQKQMMLAQAGGGGGGKSFSDRLKTVVARPRTSRALVIPKDESDAKNLADVEEDMAVMAHILDKAVGSADKTARAMGITVFGNFTGSVSSPENFYIDGTGAIFLLGVNYPLLPPPDKESAEAKDSGNSEWEEARREMAHPQPQNGEEPFMMLWGNSVGDGPQSKVEYDAEKVDDLKKNLIAALKNAANIRRLKSDETITVVVTGSEAGVISKRSAKTSSRSGIWGSSRSQHMAYSAGQPAEGGRIGDTPKLILRARKSDAEAFQNGKLDFDSFSKKVTTMIY